MGDILDTNGYFREVPGIVICLACGHGHAAKVAGAAKCSELECESCGEQFSAFISLAAIRKVLSLEEGKRE